MSYTTPHQLVLLLWLKMIQIFYNGNIHEKKNFFNIYMKLLQFLNIEKFITAILKFFILNNHTILKYLFRNSATVSDV